MVSGKLIPLPHVVIEEMVRQGLNDNEIWQILSVDKTVIRRRRIWLGLSANKRKYPPIKNVLYKAQKYGFKSLTEEEKQIAHAKIKAKNIRGRPAMLIAQRRYFAKWRKTTIRYLGKGICPKCGRDGYSSLVTQHNTKTGSVYRQIRTNHRQGRKHWKSCYSSS